MHKQTIIFYFQYLLEQRVAHGFNNTVAGQFQRLFQLFNQMTRLLPICTIEWGMSGCRIFRGVDTTLIEPT